MMGEQSIQEGLAATYLRALEADCFSHYRFIRLPIITGELSYEISEYRKIKDQQHKNIAWKKITEKHIGYFKALDDAVYSNISNRYFLNKMLKFFEEKKMYPQIEKVQRRLQEFINDRR